MAYLSLIPLAGSLLLAPIRLRGHALRLYSLIVTFLTSCAVWFLILRGYTGSLTLFRLSESYVCRFSIDRAGCVYLGIASSLWPFSVLYAAGYMERERETPFFAFYILSYAAVILLACAENLFTMYLCFELLTLSTLPLVMHSFNKQSFRAARMYLLYLFGGGALALIGIVMISRVRVPDFVPGGSLAGLKTTFMLRAMYLLCFFGFGAKAAVFPLSRWLPAASVAPTPVTALLHAVAVVNAGVYCVLRVTCSVFGTEFLRGTLARDIAVYVSAFTLIWAGVMAVREQHVKKRLAWSTVANLSYMLGAISLATPEGVLAGLVHMTFHSLMKLVLFFGAGAVMVTTGREYLHDLPGLGRRMPCTFACFTLAGLALTGVPPLCGFVSKYKLVTAGFASSDVCGVVFGASVLVSGVLCALYILPVVIEACSLSGRSARVPVPADTHDADKRMLAAMLCITLAIVCASLFPDRILSALSRAAEVLQ